MEELKEKHNELTGVINFLHKRYSGNRELAILKTINILNEERVKITEAIISEL